MNIQCWRLEILSRNCHLKDTAKEEVVITTTHSRCYSKDLSTHQFSNKWKNNSNVKIKRWMNNSKINQRKKNSNNKNSTNNHNSNKTHNVNFSKNWENNLEENRWKRDSVDLWKCSNHNNNHNKKTMKKRNKDSLKFLKLLPMP